MLLFSTFFTKFIKNHDPSILGISYSITAEQLLNETNKQRQERGLSPLSLNENLSQAAGLKAFDMIAKSYWAHFAPDGSTSPWEFIKSSGYNYVYAGENLAKGFTDSQDVVNAWLNSPTHRDNMLSDKYKDIGFAVVEGKLLGEETVLIVEMLGSTESRIMAKASQPSSAVSSKSTEEVKKVELDKNPFPQAPILGQENLETAKNGIGVFKKPFIDLTFISKNIILVIFLIMMFALTIDLIVVERKKIPRLVGHNLDHIMLIAIFILFILFQRTGVIF